MYFIISLYNHNFNLYVLLNNNPIFHFLFASPCIFCLHFSSGVFSCYFVGLSKQLIIYTCLWQHFRNNSYSKQSSTHFEIKSALSFTQASHAISRWSISLQQPASLFTKCICLCISFLLSSSKGRNSSKSTPFIIVDQCRK